MMIVKNGSSRLNALQTVSCYMAALVQAGGMWAYGFL